MAERQGNENETLNGQDNEAQEKFQEMGKIVGEQEGRLLNLQNSGFQLANYYFVFQGVILAAISNSSYLTCSNRWFLFTLSLFAALLNLYALFTIGIEYVQIKAAYDQNWAVYNKLKQEVSPQTQGVSLASLFSPLNRPQRTEARAEDEQRPWRDSYSEKRRYVYLCVCIVLFLGFTSVTLYGCWGILCKHGKCGQNPNHLNDNCVRLCNGSKCMKLCNDI